MDDPTKSRRLSQLPCPGTDGTFATPTPTRREGELWCHPIAGTEDASSKLTSLTSQGYEGTGAAAACDGLGAGDAISAGSAGSAERGCLRLGLSFCCSSCSSRRGSIALWRDRVSRELCSDTARQYSAVQVEQWPTVACSEDEVRSSAMGHERTRD